MLDGAAPLLTKGVWAGKAGKWATAGQGERPHRSPLATWTQGRASTQQDRSQQESGFPRTQLCASRPRAWLSTMAAGNSPPPTPPPRSVKDWLQAPSSESRTPQSWREVIVALFTSPVTAMVRG